jgi:membrane protease YdiL (CAAX protease family)
VVPKRKFLSATRRHVRLLRRRETPLSGGPGLRHPGPMQRRLAALFEVIGVLVAGWTLTRVVATLLGVPPLDELLSAFIREPGSDFGRLTRIGFVTLLIQFLCLMIPALLINRFVHKGRLADLGLTRGNRSLGESVRLGVALYCVAGVPMRLLLLANHHFRLGTPPSYWAIFEKDWNLSFWLFMAVGSFLVIPVFEEIFYRGYAQGRLAGEFGFAGPLFVAALFTVSHFQYLIADAFNVWMLTSLLVLALAMALSRHLTGSVAAAVVIHALMNVPIAYPYDLGVLAAMVATAIVMRREIASLAIAFRKQMKPVPVAEILMLTALVCAFAAGMSLYPELTLLAFGVLLLVSLTVQIAAGRGKPAGSTPVSPAE